MYSIPPFSVRVCLRGVQYNFYAPTSTKCFQFIPVMCVSVKYKINIFLWLQTILHVRCTEYTSHIVSHQSCVPGKYPIINLLRARRSGTDNQDGGRNNAIYFQSVSLRFSVTSWPCLDNAWSGWDAIIADHYEARMTPQIASEMTYKSR